MLHINNNYILSSVHQQMIDRLDQRGITNDVFVPAFYGCPSIAEPRSNVRVEECFRRNDRLVFRHKQKKILEAALQYYDPGDYDCIHAYSLFADGYTAMKLSEMSGVPFVAAVRNTDVNQNFRLRPDHRKFGIQVVQRASDLFFLSPAYQRQVFQSYIPKELIPGMERKIRILPNGINAFWMEHLYHRECSEELKKRLEEGDVRLIYAGRIDRNKNIGLILKAMDILQDRGMRPTLKVYGKIDDKKEFRQLRQDPRFQYEGQKAMEELLDCYRAADLFVMPSHKETFGLVYAEAMSQSLPVIYTRGQGFDEQFPEGEVGCSADSRDAGSLADAIQKTIANYSEILPGLPEKVRKFRWEDIIDQYINVYEKLRRVK